MWKAFVDMFEAAAIFGIVAVCAWFLARMIESRNKQPEPPPMREPEWFWSEETKPKEEETK